MHSLGIDLAPEQWNNGTIVNHPDKRTLQACVSNYKAQFDRAILELTMSGKLVGLKASDVMKIVKDYLNPELVAARLEKEKKEQEKRENFYSFFEAAASIKDNPGTKGLYLGTLKKIEEYYESIGLDAHDILFQDIKRSWLESFEQYCLKTERQNTVSIHLRNIRAVFNAAIDDDITTNYPFRKFKIKKEETVDKSYSAKELRTLFNYHCYPGGEQEAVDIFKLMFCLIGINSIDLANLSTKTKGRVEYRRAKTKKFYSIKVEPEAAEIIEKYRGEEHLVDIIERCPNYKTYFNRLGKTLRKVGKERVDGKKSTGKAILPDVCTGSARTSWATIAQEELDISRDIIAAALGHHTVDVTSTYLRTDWKKKVDEANRKVLDWVFYEKKK